MQRYEIYTKDDARILYEKDDYGYWVKYNDAAARIAELEAQLAAMTDERDSESRWAKEYSDWVTALEEQLASAQEREVSQQRIIDRLVAAAQGRKDE